jgi:hypothetical protein
MTRSWPIIDQAVRHLWLKLITFTKNLNKLFLENMKNFHFFNFVDFIFIFISYLKPTKCQNDHYQKLDLGKAMPVFLSNTQLYFQPAPHLKNLEL